MMRWRSPPFCSSSPAASRQGFTLVEVMVAVVVTSILLLTVYGVFTSVSGAKERLEREGEDFHRARIIFDRLGREIRGAYYRPGTRGITFAGGTDERDRAFLRLTTTAATPQERQQGGLVLVSYRLREEAEEEGGGLALYRSEEMPYLENPGEGREYRLVGGIEALRFRFYDDRGGWREEWDAEQWDGLPQMVEIVLDLRTAEGKPASFLSAVELPMLVTP